jgi:putative redox protein
MYANRKGYKVEQIEVGVYTEEIGNKTIFHREIQIKGILDEEQRKRMLQIANKCPVHKMLSNPIEILTELNQRPNSSKD